MRKGVLFLAVVLAATAPSLAVAKAKAKKTAAPAPVSSNEAGARLVGEGLRNFVLVPIQSITTPKQAAPAPKHAARKHKKHKHG